MKIEYDPEQRKRILIISDQEKIKLAEIKTSFLEYLNEYAIIERESLDLSISLHLTASAIKNDLINQRHHIINSLDFNREYQKVIYIENNGIKIDPDQFPYFASAYDLLNDEARELKVLKNILKVHLIEWMVNHDYDPKNDVGVIINQNLPKAKHDGIFADRDSEKFFEYCFKHWFREKEKPNRPISYVFRCMWKDTFDVDALELAYKIKCNQREFVEFWNTKINHRYKIPFNGKTPAIKTLEQITSSKYKQRLETLKGDFEKENFL